MDNKCPECVEKAKLLIQSEHSTFKPEDQEWLQTMPLAALEQLLSMQKKPDPTPQINRDQVVEIVKDQFKTTEQFIGLMPPDMQDQVKSGLALHQAEKDRIIKVVLANEGNAFTEDELKVMPMAQLKKIASLIPVQVNYSPMNGSNDPTANAQFKEEPMFPRAGMAAAAK